MEKIAQAVMNTIPAIAQGLESLLQMMFIYQYLFRLFRSTRWLVADELRKVKPDLKRFDNLVAEIKS